MMIRPSLKPYPIVPFFKPLQRSAMKYGDKVAVIQAVEGKIRELTFRTLNALSDRLALGLIDFGIKKDDVVALLEYNSPEYIISVYGITKAGAIVTPLNTMVKGDEAEYQLKDSEAKIIIVNKDLSNVVASIRNRTRLEKVIVIGENVPSETISFDILLKRECTLRECKMLHQLERIISPKEDLAILQYTAGTTGLPKGVMLTHYNLTVHQIQATNVMRITESDVLLNHLPFFHIYGLNTCMATAIHAGALQVVMPRFNLKEALKLIERYKVTTWLTVPVVLTMMVNNSDLVKKYDLSSLRFIVSGGSPLPTETIKKVLDTFHLVVQQGYGLTEASPGVAHNLPEKIKIDSVGIPYPDTECKIVDTETGAFKHKPLQIGELIVKGPQVMKGYWKNPSETAETVKDGWLYTGDLAYMDEEGYIYLVDRKKEVIKYKGFNIIPAELESLLAQHPAVADCAVIGKPDTLAGEVPKAYVVLKPNAVATASDLLNFVNEKVASYKAIKEVKFIESIPRSASGKILRRILIEKESL
ncbi:MAG: long-chain-fatty-acid--CoA ligase [Candidatus Bathyarchaeia archaeon]